MPISKTNSSLKESRIKCQKYEEIDYHAQIQENPLKATEMKIPKDQKVREI